MSLGCPHRCARPCDRGRWLPFPPYRAFPSKRASLVVVLTFPQDLPNLVPSLNKGVVQNPGADWRRYWRNGNGRIREDVGIPRRDGRVDIQPRNSRC